MQCYKKWRKLSSVGKSVFDTHSFHLETIVYLVYPKDVGLHWYEWQWCLNDV